ncbi:MAG: bifunctional riboflavin kinase/FAD synthetase [Clostridia bacterium]|nr:bifunctional riboflavin kinase/FAD synthetase [Clostridia bacterium]
MTLYTSLPTAPLAPSAVALGCFDGVHLGHKAVISSAVKTAKDGHLLSVVFTFDSSPRNYFVPASVPQLTDRETKISLIEAMGVDILVCLPFDQTIATTSAEEFFRNILVGTLGAKHLVCGYNYSFGAKGRGNAALLSSLCQEAGIGLHALTPIEEDGAPLSSSAIRQALEDGRIEDANTSLGRPYSIRATVLDGQHLGRRLGFPTINQRIDRAMAIPKQGVYLSRVTLEDGSAYFGITNVGTRPTVGSEFIGAETHLFDFSGDLYGKQVEVELLAFLRPERKFDSVEALSAQVHGDIETAKNMAKNFVDC